MSPTVSRRASDKQTRRAGYHNHILTFYKGYGTDDLRLMVTPEAPTQDMLIEVDAVEVESFKITTNLTFEDFYDVRLFHNNEAVLRFAKQVENGPRVA